MKLSPYFSSTGEMALRLDDAGADALVLFNRFLQPDIDPETLAVVLADRPLDAVRRTPAADVDRPPARSVRCSLAATSGVETADDVANSCSPAPTS